MAVAGEGGDEKLAGAGMGLPCRGGGLRFTQLALGHIVSGRVKACILDRDIRVVHNVLQFPHLYNRETNGPYLPVWS